MKIKQRLIAIVMTTILVGSNLLSLGNQVIAAIDEIEEQSSATNHTNVEFNSYFEGNIHEKTFSIQEGGKMYISLKINESGYLKNGIVKFSNSNYEFNSDQIKSEYVQKVEGQSIYLQQIYAGQEFLIEVPFYLQQQPTVDKDIFSRDSEIIFEGIYIDGNGKEKTIEKTIFNRVKWEAEAQIELTGEIVKYLPYQVGEEYGVLVQAKINSGIKENILPIKKTAIEIEALTLEEQKPERVTVVANNTKATNGLEDGTNFGENNYYYDAQNGKITIQVNNEPNSQGKIAWGQVKDEYLITYVYTGQEIYESIKEQLAKAEETKLTEEDKQAGKQNENSIQGSLEVKASITVYQAEEKIIEINDQISYTIEEEKGELTEFNLDSVDSISKGYLYANYAKEEKEAAGETIEKKIETIYEVTYSAQIYDAFIKQEVIFEVKPETLLASTEYEAGKNIITKQIKIEETIFQKMLGPDGKIEVATNEGTTLGIIDANSERDTNGNYILDIADAKINEIIIKTSEVITEGRIELKVEKAFITEQSYSAEQMKSFEKMTIGVIGKTNTNNKTLTKEIILKEPLSKAEISIEEGKETLSTVTVNKDVNITVVLDTSSVEYALYKNPVIEIQMPSQVKKVEVKDINLLLDDELKIKESKVLTQNGKQIILITLEGTQTKYQNISNQEQNNVISKGANITLTTDITIDPLTPSQLAEIRMYYTNENTDIYEEEYQVQSKVARQSDNSTTTIGTTSTSISLVAQTGVIAAHGMSNYHKDGSEILSINGEVQEGKLETYGEGRTVTVQGIVTNNYTNSIENVFILGRLPFQGNKEIDSATDLGSNLTMSMAQAISTTGIDNSSIKIYYSTNGEATKDLLTTQNEWTETPTDLSTIKSYLIVISGEVVASTQFEFNYNAQLPANLSYGNSSYTTYKVYYDNKTDGATIGETKTAGVIGVTTGEGPELEVSLTSNMKTTIIEEKTINYMQSNSYSRFWVKIKNNSKVDAQNVKLTVNIPENTELYQYNDSAKTYETIENNITIGDIKAGETQTIEYVLKTGKLTIEDTFVDIETSVNVIAENMEKAKTSNIISSRIIKSGYEILTNTTSTMENVIYSKSSIVEYEILVDPLTGVNNFKLHIPIPTNSEVLEAYWRATPESTTGITINQSEVIAELNELSAGATEFILRYKIGDVEEEKYSTQIYVEADDTEIAYSDEHYIYVGKTGLSGEQLKPDKIYLKEKEAFQYEFEIYTTGTGNQYNFIFENQLAKELQLVDIEGTEIVEGVQVTIESLTGETDYNNTHTSKLDSNNNLTINIPIIPANYKVTIILTVMADLTLESDDGKKIVNTATIQSNQVEKITLNEVENYIEYVNEIYVNPNTGEVDKNEPVTTGKYKITGTAWIDSNKNGEKEETEELLSGIEVMLIYKSNSQIVKDEAGINKIATTDANGTYEFSDLSNNEYLVIFLYDTGKYSITEYQKDNVGESYNSDAISMKIILDGETRYAGVTDTIKISNGNERDIDIGLFTASKFDLRLDKYITKITLTTPTIGTKVYEYTKSQLEKVEVLAKNVNKSSIVVEYKIVVTNEGQVAGYARKIIDYLPEDAKFNTEINPNWYVSDNNQTVYNASLAESIINPGESKEVSLVLSFNITDKNIGTIINNNAEIYESYNDLGLVDIDSTEANMINTEDDMSKSDIVLSIVTGKIAIYVTIGIAVVAILVIGIYEIKKRVLK